ncbi:Methyltransferase domain-containing protein [Chitinophaga sp. CF118]|uniref:class I SAM-dependent methyltransferase n=1 Tax=Chitinophaga sp. CF118 TaxID=1884367 RepID=UPI0008E1DE11|nr:class I SAM-dependent methyltransferase [Chitinophaga sp. CF118]SFD10350.1 Methyltransferase domain-containing protein [Chitinophaga sp. CF118]
MEKPVMTAAEAARQLRHPEGDAGVKMGVQMNKSNRLLYEMTLDFLSLHQGDVVLEIGMGNGHFVKELFEEEPSIHYTGLDFSDCMVEEAIQANEVLIANGNAAFYCATAEKMPVADEHFNKVFGVNVLYFWDHPEETLAEIRRVLRLGGDLVLAFRSKATMQLLPFVDQGFTLYDIEMAEKLFQQNGFKVTDVITSIEPEKLAADGSKLVQLENICMRGVKI